MKMSPCVADEENIDREIQLFESELRFNGDYICLEPDVGNLFSNYFTGQLSQDDREAFESHTEACYRCQNDVASYLILRDPILREAARFYKPQASQTFFIFIRHYID